MSIYDDLTKSSTEFVDIHGRDVQVKIDKTGEICIPIKELEHTGFKIYNKSQHSKFLVRDDDFTADFYNHLLDTARKYMINNKTCLTEGQIIGSIEKCKQMLLNKEDKNQISTSTTLIPNEIAKKEDVKYHAVKNANVDIEKRSFPDDEKENVDTKKKTYMYTNDGKSKYSSPYIELSLKKNHTVRVTFLHTLRKSVAFVRSLESESIYNEIQSLIKACKLNKDKYIEKFARCCVYLVKYENKWERCQVNILNPLTFCLMDSGRRIETDQVIGSPLEVRHFPSLANRIVYTYQSTSVKLNENDLIEVELKKELGNGSYVVNILKKIESTPQIKTNQNALNMQVTKKISNLNQEDLEDFCKPPPIQTNVDHKTPVIIIAEENNRLILQSIKGTLELAPLEESINSLENLQVLQNPRKRQMVLAQRHNIEKNIVYARAVICDLDDDIAEVEFIDYFEKMLVDRNTIRQIPKSIAEIPRVLIQAPKLTNIDTFTTEMLIFIRNKIGQRKSYSTVTTNGVFDLKDTSPLLFSQQLKMFKNMNTGCIMFSELSIFKPELRLGTYTCTDTQNFNCIYFVSSELLKKYSNQISIKDIKDESNYKPVINEVCMVFFSDMWYRGAIRQAIDEEYEVYFIDYGNTAIISSKHIRKADTSVKNVPILAFPCKLINYPNTYIGKKIVSENLCLNQSYEVLIMGLQDGKYEITIPKIYSLF